MWYKLSSQNFKESNQQGLRSKLKERKHIQRRWNMHSYGPRELVRVHSIVLMLKTGGPSVERWPLAPWQWQTLSWRQCLYERACANIVSGGRGVPSSNPPFPHISPSLSLSRSLYLTTKWDFKIVSTSRLPVTSGLVWSTDVIRVRLREIK